MRAQSEEGRDAYDALEAAALHLRGPEQQLAAARTFALLDIAAALRELAGAVRSPR